jgi:redox-sensing transcriptional repressor
LSRKISESTVRRLSLYLRILEEVGDPLGTVSSEDLAVRANTTAAQVRKDLSLFGSFGKRGLGYSVPELSGRLTEILGLTRGWRVALVGAGRMGAALFDYPGFLTRGFRIVSVFDKDPGMVGRSWGDVAIEDVSGLEQAIRVRGVEILVVAVPAQAAQGVVDRAVRAGVRAILNFAPAQLKVPEEVALKDVNMVMELEALSFTLSQKADAL